MRSHIANENVPPGELGAHPVCSQVEPGPSGKAVAGKIGTGFNNEMLLDLRARLDKFEIEKPPFTKAVGLPRLRAHWVRPEIVVRVGFIEWTGHGKLRHPRLLSVGK